MKKILILLLCSSFAMAQTRLTVADYVLAMPDNLRLTYNLEEIKTFIGNPKQSRLKEAGCDGALKDLKNDYMEVRYGGCEAGGGDGASYAWAVWRSVKAQTAFIAAIADLDANGFGSRLRFSSTRNGQKFTNVTAKILPTTTLKTAFSTCKLKLEDAQFKLPQRGTSIVVHASNSSFEYKLNWNANKAVFTLGKGKCK